MSWSTSLLRMKPPCVVKPLHLCSPKAPRSRKRRRDSCFHNLNGYPDAFLPAHQPVLVRFHAGIQNIAGFALFFLSGLRFSASPSMLLVSLRDDGPDYHVS